MTPDLDRIRKAHANALANRERGVIDSRDDDIGVLLGELERLSTDSERWRHVRKNPYCLMQDDGTGTTWLVLGDDADAAVDAARRPEK